MNQKPATEKTVALRAKLKALVERGVNGERTAAEAKLKRLESRYDFTKPVMATADIFAGVFYPSTAAEPILAFQPDDFDVALAIKQAVESETSVRCVWRDGMLMAAATPQSAEKLEAIAKTVAESFIVLWGKLKQAGIDPADRGSFMAGLGDGMLGEVRVNQPLPSRPRKAKKRALNHAPGIAIHPYAVATKLGKDIRFSIPLETIAGELAEKLQQALPQAA